MIKIKEEIINFCEYIEDIKICSEEKALEHVKSHINIFSKEIEWDSYI